MNQPDQCDMNARHYKPSGKVPICGAYVRVMNLAKENLTSVPTTSDLDKVECLKCKQAIQAIVNLWFLPTNPHGRS